MGWWICAYRVRVRVRVRVRGGGYVHIGSILSSSTLGSSTLNMYCM